MDDLDRESDKFFSLNGKLFTALTAMLRQAQNEGTKQLIHDVGQEMQRCSSAGKFLTGGARGAHDRRLFQSVRRV